MTTSGQFKDPHQGQPVMFAGTDLSRAKAVMVMLHGRGAGAHDILSLVPELNNQNFTYAAPQALGNTWYPHSFLAPMSDNEPGLSSGLQVIAEVLEQLKQNGFPPGKVILLGFSQGGCLTLEFAARNPQRYGGVIGLSAGLIGPEGTPRDYHGSMSGTPIFLGCDEQDFHIPKERVHETKAVFEELEGQVTERIYSNMGHTISRDEIFIVQDMMQGILNP